jgi:hypothetical protein
VPLALLDSRLLWGTSIALQNICSWILRGFDSNFDSKQAPLSQGKSNILLNRQLGTAPKGSETSNGLVRAELGGLLDGTFGS